MPAARRQTEGPAALSKAQFRSWRFTHIIDEPGLRTFGGRRSPSDLICRACQKVSQYKERASRTRCPLWYIFHLRLTPGQIVLPERASYDPSQLVSPPVVVAAHHVIRPVIHRTVVGRVR